MEEKEIREAHVTELRIKPSPKGVLLRASGSVFVGLLAAASILLLGLTGQVLAALLLAAYLVPPIINLANHLEHLGDHADVNATIKAFKKREENRNGDNINAGGE